MHDAVHDAVHDSAHDAVHDSAARTESILAIARTVLGRPALGATDDLAQHGGSSLSIVRIVAESVRLLGLDIDPSEAGDPLTVAGLAAAARPAS